MRDNRIGPQEIEVLGMMLANDAVTPGKLFPMTLGNGAATCNAMMYDKFHGDGYHLDLLRGEFVAQSKDFIDDGKPKPTLTPPCPPGPPPS